MIDIEYRRATLISAIAALLVVIFVYALFASVDIAIMKGEEEIGYKANVMVFSDLDLGTEGEEADPALEGLTLTYTSGEQTKEYKGDFSFRLEIVKTTLVNLFTFNWTDDANVIVLQAK